MNYTLGGIIRDFLTNFIMGTDEWNNYSRNCILNRVLRWIFRIFLVRKTWTTDCTVCPSGWQQTVRLVCLLSWIFCLFDVCSLLCAEDPNFLSGFYSTGWMKWAAASGMKPAISEWLLLQTVGGVEAGGWSWDSHLVLGASGAPYLTLFPCG